MKTRKILVAIMVFLLTASISTGTANAWYGTSTRDGDLTNSNDNGHGYISIVAYTYYTDFEDYLDDYSLKTTFLKYVAEADVIAEKEYVAKLDDTYSNYYIWEKAGGISIQHASASFRENLVLNPMIHNSIELLKLALSLKTNDRSTSMRIFGNAVHLAQDHFAHLNAPGGGDEHNPHGIPDTIKVNNHPVGKLCDKLAWDLHSDRNDVGISESKYRSDVYDVDSWHYDTTRTNNWRFNAAKAITIEMMKAYIEYETTDFYEGALRRGYIEIDGDMTYINYAARIIVDNNKQSRNAEMSECTFDSSWATSDSVSGHYLEDYAHDGSSSADGSKWAKFTPYISDAGLYKIYMRWAASSGRPDAAPLEIYHADGIDNSKTVNQQQNGGIWNYVGTYYLDEGTDNYVKITGADSGYTVADAVMFERVEYVIVDNTDNECTFDSSWTASTSVSGYYGSNYTHDGTSNADTASRWAKWTPDLPIDGIYNVYMRWAASSNKPDAAPVKIQHDDGYEYLYVNQEENGGIWNYLGSFDMSEGTSSYVQIFADEEGYTEADAVMFELAEYTRYIDNTEPECTFGSSWIDGDIELISGFYGSDFVQDGTSGADTSAKWAKWELDVPYNGTYEIYIRWPENTNNAPDAVPVEINYKNGTDTSQTIDQTTDGSEWYLLGTYDLDDNSGYYVKINATDSGYTVADAVKIVLVN